MITCIAIMMRARVKLEETTACNNFECHLESKHPVAYNDSGNATDIPVHTCRTLNTLQDEECQALCNPP
jgi:hypothetical protein